MRFVILLFCLFLLGCSCRLSAQVLHGKIVDSQSRVTLPYVSIRISGKPSGIVSTAEGSFSLDISGIGANDSLIVSLIGYYPYSARISNLDPRKELVISLYEKTTLLSEVLIKGRSTHYADSLSKRDQFASAFNYRAPRLKDAFLEVLPTTDNRIPPKPSSFNSLIGVNLLKLLALSNSNQTVSKLQKSLLKDEEIDFVDQAFSKEKISLITKMKGDSLLDFTNRYRPSAAWLKKVSDYELIQYIRRSYAEFLKTYGKDNYNPLIKKPMKTEFK